MILEKDFISKHKIKTKVTNSFRRTKCWLLIKIEASTMKWLSFQCFRVNTTIVIIDCNDFRCWLFVSHSKISKNDQMFFSQQFIINDRFQTELEIVVCLFHFSNISNSFFSFSKYSNRWILFDFSWYGSKFTRRQHG